MITSSTYSATLGHSIGLILAFCNFAETTIFSIFCVYYILVAYRKSIWVIDDQIMQISNNFNSNCHVDTFQLLWLGLRHYLLQFPYCDSLRITNLLPCCHSRGVCDCGGFCGEPALEDELIGIANGQIFEVLQGQKGKVRTSSGSSGEGKRIDVGGEGDNAGVGNQGEIYFFMMIHETTAIFSLIISKKKTQTAPLMVMPFPVSNADLKQMRSLSLVVVPPGCELGLEDGLDLVDRFHPRLHLLPVLQSFLRVLLQALQASPQLLLLKLADHYLQVPLELIHQGDSLFIVFADDLAHFIDGFVEQRAEIWQFRLVVEVAFELLVGLSDSALLHFSIQLQGSKNESDFQRKLNSLGPYHF